MALRRDPWPAEVVLVSPWFQTLSWPSGPASAEPALRGTARTPCSK